MSAERAILALVGSILSLAVLSVIVSQKANTSGVIQASTSGLATLIGAAEAPVTGGTSSGSGSVVSSLFNSFLPTVG